MLRKPLLPYYAAMRPEVSAILAEAVWQPTPEKVRQVLDAYERDPGQQLFVWLDDGQEPQVAGVIGLSGAGGSLEGRSPASATAAEIRHLAVAQGKRGQGIGRAMVYSLPTVTSCSEVIAETGTGWASTGTSALPWRALARSTRAPNASAAAFACPGAWPRWRRGGTKTVGAGDRLRPTCFFDGGRTNPSGAEIFPQR
ncbi:MAG: GNAT family N-acetyltransferase [Bacillota bacterium]